MIYKVVSYDLILIIQYSKSTGQSTQSERQSRYRTENNTHQIKAATQFPFRTHILCAFPRISSKRVYNLLPQTTPTRVSVLYIYNAKRNIYPLLSSFIYIGSRKFENFNWPFIYQMIHILQNYPRTQTPYSTTSSTIMHKTHTCVYIIRLVL